MWLGNSNTGYDDGDGVGNGSSDSNAYAAKACVVCARHCSKPVIDFM